MANPAIAQAMIAEIDKMQALTEEERGDIEKQLITLRDAMIKKFGIDRYYPFIEEFRDQNDLLAVTAMEGATERSILQATRSDLISHYKAKGIQIAGRRKTRATKRSKRSKTSRKTK